MNGRGSEAAEKACERLEQEEAKGKRGRDEGPSSLTDFHPYPKALASYEDVIADPKLFRETLEKLHAAMGTKFMVPIIGGKDLDLHRLFVEVTSRGGIEKVISDRRWREVTASFTFPSTATNASFVLRKYYMSLLRHYEQLYFFRSQGWSSPAVSSVPSERFFEHNVPHRTTQAGSSKRMRSNAYLGLSSGPYPQVVGVIDGKFESGYFVTVTVGSTKLKGVLYHFPQQTSMQIKQCTDFAGNSSNSTSSCRRRRQRKKLSKRDPSHPKPNRSGYNFFFAEQHAKLKPLYPGKDREISKMIGDSWNKLSESEKAVYQDKGIKDKERYRSEMAVYMGKLKAGHVISNAMPIQQLPAEPEMLQGLHSKLQNAEAHLEVNGDNVSGSESSDSEGKLSDEDSDMEASPELGVVASASLAEPSTEGDDYELRRRVDGKSEIEQDPYSFTREMGVQEAHGVN